MSEPAAGGVPGSELATLRAELDRLDDQLHDLLMQRAAIATRIGASAEKGRVKLRPGREAAILRRLRGRHHGPLGFAGVVRVWREILAGSLAMQGAVSVAVPHSVQGLASAHFGAGPALGVVATTADALASVREGRSDLAVIPAGDEGWPLRLTDTAPRLYVVALLPIWTGGGLDGPGAYVISPQPPDPSGQDMTLLRDADGKLVERPGFPDTITPDVLGAYALPLDRPMDQGTPL